MDDVFWYMYFGIYNVALFPYTISDVNWHTAQKYDNKCMYNHKVDIILLLTMNVPNVAMITLRRINLTKTKIPTIRFRCTNPYSVRRCAIHRPRPHCQRALSANRQRC